MKSSKGFSYSALSAVLWGITEVPKESFGDATVYLTAFNGFMADRVNLAAQKAAFSRNANRKNAQAAGNINKIQIFFNPHTSVSGCIYQQLTADMVKNCATMAILCYKGQKFTLKLSLFIFKVVI